MPPGPGIAAKKTRSSELRQFLKQIVKQQKQMLEKLDTMENRTTITHRS